MSKPEDDLAREKEAVQKLIGAKGAMEAALLRIRRLEEVITTITSDVDDVAASIGDGLHVVTYRHGNDGKTMRLKAYLLKTAEKGRAVL